MSARLDHINLTVTNLEESLKWYKEVFGFKKLEGGVTNLGKVWAIVGLDDSMIAMSEYSEKIPADKNRDYSAHRIFHFGIRVSDLRDWKERLQRLNLRLYYGGEIEYPHSRSWYIHDPSGHEIEVSYSGGVPLKFISSDPEA